MEEKVQDINSKYATQEMVRRNIEVCISVLKMIQQCREVDMKGEVLLATRKKLLEHINQLNTNV